MAQPSPGRLLPKPPVQAAHTLTQPEWSPRRALPYLRPGLSVGAALRVEEEGDVGHEGRHHLSHVQFWDLIGLELLPVIELCQVLLKRLAETERGAHLLGLALVGKEVQLETLSPEDKETGHLCL